MSDHLALVEQKLSDSLRVAAVSADFEVGEFRGSGVSGLGIWGLEVDRV